jgi:pimeloyl-ACP methyl ester carboxylesterase
MSNDTIASPVAVDIARLPKPVFLSVVLVALCVYLPASADEASSPPTLELSDCRIHAGPGYPGIKARCGVFERLLDPDDASSTLLKLSVAVVPALSLEAEPDPLVPIAGGPGGASISFYAGYAQAFEKVRRHREILLIDQRGTGESEMMSCDLGDELLEGRFSREDTIANTESCLDMLPHDPRFFTTSIAVRDLEALRQALGYPALNLYGSSYGTRVAQHYARRFPATTRSVILDGVVPPQLPLGPGIALEAQKALLAIFNRCTASPDCNSAFPGVADAFAQLEADLAEQSVTVELSHPRSGERELVEFGDMEFAAVIRLMSYSPDTVALMPLLIHEAANGNFVPLAATFLVIEADMSEQIANGMHNAVVCTEDTPFYADIDIAALDKTYLGAMMTEALQATCSVWPAGVLDDDLREPLNTDTPVLLLSGSADPITPPYFAELAAVAMGNARHLIGADQGHGLANRGCMPDIVGRFVASASVDELATDCMERLYVMPFFLDFAGPAP